MYITITACTPEQLAHLVQHHSISVHYYATPAGVLEVRKIPQGIYHAVFVQQPVHATLEPLPTTVHVVVAGTSFALTTLQKLLTIPSGTTLTYQELAQCVGKPTAWRAVARVVARNDVAYFIPCHRIIGKSGKLCGYRWGLEIKKLLLQAEQGS